MKIKNKNYHMWGYAVNESPPNGGYELGLESKRDIMTEFKPVNAVNSLRTTYRAQWGDEK